MPRQYIHTVNYQTHTENFTKTHRHPFTYKHVKKSKEKRIIPSTQSRIFNFHSELTKRNFYYLQRLQYDTPIYNTQLNTKTHTENSYSLSSLYIPMCIRVRKKEIYHPHKVEYSISTVNSLRENFYYFQRLQYDATIYNTQLNTKTHTENLYSLSSLYIPMCIRVRKKEIYHPHKVEYSISKS
jgi:hypothetical protein